MNTRNILPRILGAMGLLLLATPVVFAQGPFNSTSDGSDGPLNLRAPAPARNLFRMAYDGAEVLMFGGSTSGALIADTWTYDGNDWTESPTVTQPGARSGHALTYDSNRGVGVLFGGKTTAVQQDTWEFGPAGWVAKTPAVRPPAREQHYMVFDSVNNVVVLFGGRDAGQTPFADTWEFDGTIWTNTANSGPAARRGHAMAFNSLSGKVVLFGGTGAGTFADTWEYNAASNSWAVVATPGTPTPRHSFDMVYDATRDKTVLFSGSNGVNDTWEFDGSTWSPVAAGNPPPARLQHGMAYDTVRKRSVLFGGLVDSVQASDTWEYDGTNWVQQAIAFNQVIDLNEKPDGVFNHTTIDIENGVTVSFTQNTNNTPVIWLATGDVNINGIVLVNGESGNDPDIAPGDRPAAGPAGGYGGRGGRDTLVTQTNVFAGEPGGGLGGGFPGVAENENGGDAGHATAGALPNGGPAYGNLLANPIQGGSGGGGGSSNAGNDGGNGGAGGGAILIASSGTINYDGILNANGGVGEATGAGNGGNGSGGTIRFVANRVEGAGTLVAGINGRVRLEGFFVNMTGSIGPLQAESPPYVIDLANQATLAITDVEGQAVVNPGGDVNNPDVVFTETGTVSVTVDASANVPDQTPIKVRITSTGFVETLTANLVGAGGTVTVNFPSVPAGVGTIQAFATFTVP